VLASEDLELMAQHQDLHLLGRLAPQEQHDQGQHPTDGEVENDQR
jgi:hypothetical protein